MRKTIISSYLSIFEESCSNFLSASFFPLSHKCAELIQPFNPIRCGLFECLNNNHTCYWKKSHCVLMVWMKDYCLGIVDNIHNLHFTQFQNLFPIIGLAFRKFATVQVLMVWMKDYCLGIVDNINILQKCWDEKRKVTKVQSIRRGIL